MKKKAAVLTLKEGCSVDLLMNNLFKCDKIKH